MDQISSSVYSFEINILGNLTGKLYDGKFIYQRPTIGKKRDIIKEEMILNSSYSDYPNLEIMAINSAVAFLKVTLLECPQWFKDLNYGLDVLDENIFDEISKKIKSFEDQLIKNVENRTKEKIEIKKDE